MEPARGKVGYSTSLCTSNFPPVKSLASGIEEFAFNPTANRKIAVCRVLRVWPC